MEKAEEAETGKADKQRDLTREEKKRSDGRRATAAPKVKISIIHGFKPAKQTIEIMQWTFRRSKTFWGPCLLYLK